MGTTISLPEYVYRVVAKEGITSEEFEDLVKAYGKAKLRDLYLKGKQAIEEKNKYDVRKKASGDREE